MSRLLCMKYMCSVYLLYCVYQDVAVCCLLVFVWNKYISNSAFGKIKMYREWEAQGGQ